MRKFAVIEPAGDNYVVRVGKKYLNENGHPVKRKNAHELAEHLAYGFAGAHGYFPIAQEELEALIADVEEFNAGTGVRRELKKALEEASEK